MKKMPKSRVSNLVVQSIGNETLVYDLSKNKAMSLNETCSIAWKYCDGKTHINEIIDKHNLHKEIIYIALDELQKRDLIQGKKERFIPNNKFERRRFLIKAGAVAAVSLPVISAVVAPLAVSAQSCLVQGSSCNVASICCSGLTCCITSPPPTCEAVCF